MTGSYPDKGGAGRFKAKPRQMPWSFKRSAEAGNLLYVRTKSREKVRVGNDFSGAVLTLLGVTLGLAVGYLIYELNFVNLFIPIHDFVVWVMAVCALSGGAIGALAAWLRARAHLAQALVTSEGFRQRLMSIERNQALWVSLSAVLHDVRNPLHNISLLVESLAAPGMDVPQVAQQIGEQLERIHVRIRRVTRQIAELSGEIERRAIDLDGVLAEVSEMVRPLARQARVNLTVASSGHVQVLADPKFLVQAIDHLILNSLQILSEQPAHVGRSLRIQYHRVKADIEMWVEDSGPGLPDEVRARLFEPLTTCRTSGMGLGLAIAHALASAAGAELTMGHTGPKGTRFILHLRVAG